MAGIFHFKGDGFGQIVVPVCRTAEFRHERDPEDAAILVADVVDYRRLAGADEDRVLARLRALRSDFIDPTIAVRHGRVVKRTDEWGAAE